MKSKKIIFLGSLPRSGNTLLGSLINQSSQIAFTANTILCDVVHGFFNYTNNLKKNDIFINFPDHSSLENIKNNLFNCYYEKWKANYIIERGPWGTPANLEIINSIFKKDLKFIILYRPVLEVIASFIKLFKEQKKEYNVEYWMSPEGIIGKNMYSIQNIINTKQNYLLIKYNYLTKNPQKQINKIFNFLNLKKEKIKFKNFKQFEINDIKYEDYEIKNLHKIRTDKINKSKYNYKKYLTKDLINKYSKLDIL